MIKFTFKLNKETLTGYCPENWGEVTLQNIIDLEKCKQGDKIEVLSAFTGLDVRTIENARGDLFKPMYQVLSFVFESPNWQKLKVPKTVTLNDKVIKPPKKLNLETFGQKWRAVEAIQSADNKIDCIPDILAIYLQPAYDGVFETSRIPDIKEYVLKMKAFEAMPYGFFFFKRLEGLNLLGLLGLNLSLRTMKNLLYIRKREAESWSPTTTL